MERKTNFSILVMLNVETRLAVVCKQRILRFFGHIIRDRSILKKLMIEEKIEGKRSRGRTPIRWIDKIKTITGYLWEKPFHRQKTVSFGKEMLSMSTNGSSNFRFWKMDLRRRLR